MQSLSVEMKSVSRAVFVHEGKAAYPEVSALSAWLKTYTAVSESKACDLKDFQDLQQAICWCMMGLYCLRPHARIVIHDYRSLSVGKLGRFKDYAKRMFNAKPNIRIFQNDEIRSRLGFLNDIPSVIMPMGVPDAFVERPLKTDDGPDFIYIGSLLPERRCHVMLESFLARYGRSKTFHIYGSPIDKLGNIYRAFSNVRFFESIPQTQLKHILASSGAAVCYFPLHAPHMMQTPTKLLEYAAMGMRIIANEHPQSRLTAKHYGLNVFWGDGADMFAAAPDSISWPDNLAVDPRPMTWSNVIANSDIGQSLTAALSNRR